MAVPNWAVAEAFMQQRPKRGEHLRSNGTWYISYRTPVARWWSGAIFITSTKYSSTTTGHLSLLSGTIMTDDLNDPVAGAIRYIRGIHEQEMRRKMMTASLRYYMLSAQGRQAHIDALAQKFNLPPQPPLRYPRRFLQRCADAGIEFDFRLWALTEEDLDRE